VYGESSEQSEREDIEHGPTTARAAGEASAGGDGEAVSETGTGPPRQGILDVFYGVLFKPRETMEALAERPPLGLGVATFVGVSVVSGLVGFSRARINLPDATYEGAGFGWPLLVTVPLGLVLWFVLVAIYHLTADLLGGRGSGRALLALAGLAQLPGIFRAPVILLGRGLGTGLDTILLIALWLWTLYLTALSIKSTHALPMGRAVLTVFIPVVLIGVVVVVAVVVLIAFLPGLPVLPGAGLGV